MDRKTDYVALGVVFGFFYSHSFSFIYLFIYLFIIIIIILMSCGLPTLSRYALDVNICTHIKTNYKLDFDHLDYLWMINAMGVWWGNFLFVF